MGRPGNNHPGVFPASSLLGHEKVLYETRPGLIGLHGVLVIAPMPFVLLIVLAVVAGLVQMGFQGDLIGGGTFIALILLIPVAYAVSDWRRSSYALTDQRVLSRRGDSYQSATYDEVEEVTMKPGSSKVIFRLTPLAPGQPRGLFSGSGRQILWPATPGAPAVASFAQSASEFYRLRNRQRQLRQDLVVSSMQDKIVCAYCGGLVDVASLSPDGPKCPRCSAPITVAPIGM
jgi:hypothetical protein